jgi:hypothetical protein
MMLLFEVVIGLGGGTNAVRSFVSIDMRCCLIVGFPGVDVI